METELLAVAVAVPVVLVVVFALILIVCCIRSRKLREFFGVGGGSSGGGNDDNRGYYYSNEKGGGVIGVHSYNNRGGGGGGRDTKDHRFNNINGGGGPQKNGEISTIASYNASGKPSKYNPQQKQQQQPQAPPQNASRKQRNISLDPGGKEPRWPGPKGGARDSNSSMEVDSVISAGSNNSGLIDEDAFRRSNISTDSEMSDFSGVTGSSLRSSLRKKGSRSRVPKSAKIAFESDDPDRDEEERIRRKKEYGLQQQKQKSHTNAVFTFDDEDGGDLGQKVNKRRAGSPPPASRGIDIDSDEEEEGVIPQILIIPGAAARRAEAPHAPPPPVSAPAPPAPQKAKKVIKRKGNQGQVVKVENSSGGINSSREDGSQMSGSDLDPFSPAISYHPDATRKKRSYGKVRPPRASSTERGSKVSEPSTITASGAQGAGPNVAESGKFWRTDPKRRSSGRRKKSRPKPREDAEHRARENKAFSIEEDDPAAFAKISSNPAGAAASSTTFQSPDDPANRYSGYASDSSAGSSLRITDV